MGLGLARHKAHAAYCKWYGDCDDGSRSDERVAVGLDPMRGTELGPYEVGAGLNRG